MGASGEATCSVSAHLLAVGSVVQLAGALESTQVGPGGAEQARLHPSLTRSEGPLKGPATCPAPPPWGGENLASGSRAPTSQEALRQEELSIHIAGIFFFFFFVEKEKNENPSSLGLWENIPFM